MFERLTKTARQTLVLAQEEARETRHGWIGTEHILLGLLRVEEGLAARVLDSFDMTPDRVRDGIKRIVGEGSPEVEPPEQIPFTPRAKKALELALPEALSLGHNYIGTEHILLGLIRENEGVAMHILLDLGVDAEKVRNEVIRLLTTPLAKQILKEHRRPANLAWAIERAQDAKADALAAGDFETAAEHRDRERKLQALQAEKLGPLRQALGDDPKFWLCVADAAQKIARGLIGMDEPGGEPSDAQDGDDTA